jgi:hypothetical protein
MSAVRRWHAYLAEPTGAHHVANDLVHQDACAVAPASGTSDGSKLTVAVADGHGHARRFRPALAAPAAAPGLLSRPPSLRTPYGPSMVDNASSGPPFRRSTGGSAEVAAATGGAA